MKRRVIFPDPTIWGHHRKDHHHTMTDHDDNRAPVRRRLDDDERELLIQLTIWSLAEQTGVTDDEAQQALDKLNQESGLDITGDDYDVYVRTRQHGHVIVHCTREWLDFHAHSGEQLTSEELRRSLTYLPKHEQGGGE